MQAIIISIGDELVLGQTVDTNSAWLSARLVARGILTRAHLTAPDDRAAIARVLRQAAGEAELIIITGGLGPTADDLTRDALADWAGAPLEMNAAALASLEAFFKARQRPMSASNRVQAMGPAGAEFLENTCGTAPGLLLRRGPTQVFAMPGVPSEMRAMFEKQVAPRLPSQSGRVILSEVLHTFGVGESVVGERLGELMARSRNPKVGTTVAGGVVSVRVRSEFATTAEAREQLAATVAEVRRRLGTAVFGEGSATLPEVVGNLLRQRRLTLATAESCTAGLLGKLLTDLAGASAYYLGGWIVYANTLKSSALDVSAELIAREGAVSEAVARRMAEQALLRSGADYALALTGIAGPAPSAAKGPLAPSAPARRGDVDGGTAEKPVGTVWIALARCGGGAPEIRAERFLFPGERELVRERAAKTALNLLRLELLGKVRWAGDVQEINFRGARNPPLAPPGRG